MPTKTAEELSVLTRALLMAAGADERNANRMAEALVASNLCGVETHGVVHLPRYVEAIDAAGLYPPSGHPCCARRRRVRS